MNILNMPQKVTFPFRCMFYIEHSFIYLSWTFYTCPKRTQLYLFLPWTFYTCPKRIYFCLDVFLHWAQLYLSLMNILNMPLKVTLPFRWMFYIKHSYISLSLYIPHKVTFPFRCTFYIEYSYISLSHENSIHQVTFWFQSAPNTQSNCLA